jgi:hypothetical protein
MVGGQFPASGFQYVDAHMPTSINAFTIKLAPIAAHVSNVATAAIGAVRLCLMTPTIASIVVTGVTNRNHNVKISAKFNGNQCGMRRSMGKAKRQATNPNKAGEHHQNENHFVPCCGCDSSGFVTVSSSIMRASAIAADHVVPTRRTLILARACRFVETCMPPSKLGANPIS